MDINSKDPKPVVVLVLAAVIQIFGKTVTTPEQAVAKALALLKAVKDSDG